MSIEGAAWPWESSDSAKKVPNDKSFNEDSKGYSESFLKFLDKDEGDIYNLNEENPVKTSIPRVPSPSPVGNRIVKPLPATPPIPPSIVSTSIGSRFVKPLPLSPAQPVVLPPPPLFDPLTLPPPLVDPLILPPPLSAPPAIEPIAPNDEENDNTTPGLINYETDRPIIIPTLDSMNSSRKSYMPPIGQPGQKTNIQRIDWSTQKDQWHNIYKTSLRAMTPGTIINQFSEENNYRVSLNSSRPLDRIITLVNFIDVKFNSNKDQRISKSMQFLNREIKNKLNKLLGEYDYKALINADKRELRSKQNQSLKHKYKNIARNIEYVVAYCYYNWLNEFNRLNRPIELGPKNQALYKYIVEKIDTCNWSQVHQKILSEKDTDGKIIFKYDELKTFLTWYLLEPTKAVDFCDIKRLKIENSFGSIVLKQDKNLIYGGVIMEGVSNIIRNHGKQILVAIVVVLVLYLLYRFSTHDSRRYEEAPQVPANKTGAYGAPSEGLRGFRRENMCRSRCEGYVPISEQEGMCGAPREGYVPISEQEGLSSFCESKDTRVEGMVPTGRLDLSGLRNFVADLSRSEGYTENALNNTEIDNTRSFVEGSGSVTSGKVLRSENLSSLDLKLRESVSGL